MPSWRCTLCRVDNDSNVSSCVACEMSRETPPGGSLAPSFGGLACATGSTFASALGASPSTTDAHRFTFGFGPAEAQTPTKDAESSEDDLLIYGMCGDERREITRRPSEGGSGSYGKLFTWGASECDQLAVDASLCDDLGYLPLPHEIKELENEKITAVACGALHTIALTVDGHVFSWGCNDDGALGRPVNEVDLTERSPALVNVPGGVTSICCGDSHSTALTSSGQLFIWGSYKDGGGHIGAPDFSGEETTNKIEVPVNVLGLEGKVLRVACGDNHTLAMIERLDGSRSVEAWGSNEFGQLGQEIVEDLEQKRKYLYPHVMLVPDNERLLDVFATGAASFVCTEGSDGTLKVFGCGRNGRHELGVANEGEEVCRPQLVEVEALRGLSIRMICGGQFSAVALTAEGQVFSWGKGSVSGQGRAFVKDTQLDVVVPTQMAGLSDVGFVGAGSDTTFAVSRDGLMFAWGDGSMYQLANGEDDDLPVGRPLVVRPSIFGGGAVLAVVGGSSHSVALVFSGETTKRRRRAAEEEAVVAPTKRQRKAPEGKVAAGRQKKEEEEGPQEKSEVTAVATEARGAVKRTKRQKPEAVISKLVARRVSPRLMELEAKRVAEEVEKSRVIKKQEEKGGPNKRTRSKKHM